MQNMKNVGMSVISLFCILENALHIILHSQHICLHIILHILGRKARIPCSSRAGGVGSIPANPDAQNVPSFRRWRFEMKLSPFLLQHVQEELVEQSILF